MSEVADILRENERRNAEVFAPFNPVTGEGSILARVRVEVSDFPIRVQWLPEGMLDVPLVKRLVEAGSVAAFYEGLGEEQAYTEEVYQYIVRKFVRVRCMYDFPFWAVMYVLISNKTGGDDIHFSLNRPQRLLVTRFEEMRMNGEPIRLILLKARQWGGSTATQIYIWRGCSWCIRLV